MFEVLFATRSVLMGFCCRLSIAWLHCVTVAFLQPLQ